MIKKIKYFLWSNKFTSKIYSVLWLLKNKGMKFTINKLKPKSKKKVDTVQNNNKSKNTKTTPIGDINIKRNDLYRLIHELWNSQGATDELMTTLCMITQSRWCWNQLPHQIFLIYVCCLVELDNLPLAKKILSQYIAKFGKKDIFRYMPASQLFVQMGYKDFDIERTNFVFTQLEENRKNNVLENLLEGKSIAVVGNGGNELGKNRGAEIDSHDIVLRFNNYPESYEDDYGYKTDVWVRNGNISLLDKDIIENLQLVIWEPDYWHMNVQHNHLNLLYRDLRNYPLKLVYLSNIRKEIYDNSDILNPTTGAQIIYYLIKNKDSMKNINFFGFSFLENIDKVDFSHFYDNLSNAHTFHQPTIEVKYLQELISNSNNFSKGVNFKIEYPIFSIYSCAYRKFNIKLGKTGGPGGVLNLQKKLINKKIYSMNNEYIFEPNKLIMSEQLKNEIKEYSSKASTIIIASHFIQSNPKIRDDLTDNKIPVLICHDVGSAYGAYLYGLDYILIYHQQGSLLNEFIASGGEPTARDEKYFNQVEKRVLENAFKVYFPSLGAKQMLIDTSDNAKNLDKINYSDTALYNTIPIIDTNSINPKLLKKLKLPKINNNTQVFFSCGDFNYDKGMDNIPAFLNEYVRVTNKNVLWIAIGSATSNTIFETLQNEQSSWNFNSKLIGERVDHDTLIALLNYCDYYIMLHRKSIFDLAILEALQLSKPVILSNIGGNNDFNVCDNVEFLKDNNYKECIEKICNRDYNSWCKASKKAFDNHFSNEVFIKNYNLAIKELLVYKGLILREKSEINKNTFTQFKNIYKGKKAIICGAGSSLQEYSYNNQNIHIALNKTLFFENIKFNYLFMQDYPKNQDYTLDDYNNYDCVKFYGIIKNPNVKADGISDFDLSQSSIVNKVYRYELSPVHYNNVLDDFELDIDEYTLTDAQSVLFSAIQFAVYCGFDEIELYGVDFSDINYDNLDNASVYASSVVDNLLAFKRQFIKQKLHSKLKIGATTNAILKDSF